MAGMMLALRVLFARGSFGVVLWWNFCYKLNWFEDSSVSHYNIICENHITNRTTSWPLVCTHSQIPNQVLFMAVSNPWLYATIFMLCLLVYIQHWSLTSWDPFTNGSIIYSALDDPQYFGEYRCSFTSGPILYSVKNTLHVGSCQKYTNKMVM